MSMIGSERYAEAMKIAPGQQRFRGAFTKKPSLELLSISSLDHLTYCSLWTAVLLHQVYRSRYCIDPAPAYVPGRHSP
jgi:hypothetical protein